MANLSDRYGDIAEEMDTVVAVYEMAAPIRWLLNSYEGALKSGTARQISVEVDDKNGVICVRWVTLSNVRFNMGAPVDQLMLSIVDLKAAKIPKHRWHEYEMGFISADNRAQEKRFAEWAKAREFAEGGPREYRYYWEDEESTTETYTSIEELKENWVGGGAVLQSRLVKRGVWSEHVDENGG